MALVRRRAATIAAVSGLLVVTTATATAAPAAPTVPDRYAEQTIDWHDCAADELPHPAPPSADLLECGVFSAPRDWTDPRSDADLTIAISRLPATTGKADRTIVTNPGGPGAPGRAFPLRLREQDRVRAVFDIVGFDPRGTGKSTDITCGGATRDLDPLDPRDRGAENIELILDTTENAAQECQKRSGDLGPLINTFQTVRDIDLLRSLLDREKISWVGYSAGTWLGAHYATAFPDRVDRFVLDSNVEFTTDWQSSFDWQPMGFERRWRADFLPWIARYDSVYDFGRTGLHARLTYERVRAALQEQPVELDGQKIGPNEFDTQIIGAMYNKRAFIGLAEYLVAVRALTEDETSESERRAALTTLETLHTREIGPGPRPLVVPIDDDDAYAASFWSIPCNETDWSGDRESVVVQSDRLGERYPLLGWGWLIQPCIFWHNDPISLPVPTGDGVPPVLMVQSTHDPATPLEGARRAHHNFEGSAMLTVIDEGDHGLYAGG
ncbi:MAG: alpha/beta hydrolase, partial [Haloechinothrix sp.]